MDGEVRCKIEIEEFNFNENQQTELKAAIVEKTKEENAIVKEQEEEIIVKIEQEDDKTEFVEIKQEPSLFENEIGQANTESLPDPLLIHALNTTIEIEEKPKIEEIEPNKTHVNEKREKKFQCQFCEKKFFQKHVKVRHERTHIKLAWHRQQESKKVGEEA